MLFNLRLIDAVTVPSVQEALFVTELPPAALVEAQVAILPLAAILHRQIAVGAVLIPTVVVARRDAHVMLEPAPQIAAPESDAVG